MGKQEFNQVISMTVALGVSALIGVPVIGPLVGALAAYGVSYALAELGLTAEIPQPEAVSEERALQLTGSYTQQFIQVVYGEFRVGGVFSFLGLAQSNILGQIVVFSEGEVELCWPFYMNGWQIDFPDDPDNPYFDLWVSGEIQTENHEGSYDQAASALLTYYFPGTWTPAHRLRNTAYGAFIVYFNAASSSAGIPKWQARVKGRLLYDPRSELTEYAKNPALAILDYLSSTRYGVGVEDPEMRLDIASFIVAANHCDEEITLGGETVPRYECDGVIDPSRPIIQNLQQLLSSCRGLLIYSGGVYKLIIDKEETPGFEFTEKNIVGDWSFHPGGREDRLNAAKARYYSKDAEYSSQTEIYEDEELRTTEDGGALLEREFDLPFVTDWRYAQMHARLVVNQSRYSMGVQFTATIEGLRAEAGDVVKITHSTPGWTEKTFRILDVQLTPDNLVRITAIEYNASVYDFGTIPARSSTPALSRFGFDRVDAPGVPYVRAQNYTTRDGSSTRLKAVCEWKPAPTAGLAVIGYEIAYKPSGGAWIFAGFTPEASIEVLDLDPGYYDVRVRAVNFNQVRSAWTVFENVQLNANVAPAALTGLEISTQYNIAVLTWDRPTEADVLNGGEILIRHSDDKTSPAWSSGHWIAGKIPGSQCHALVPLIEGSYMLKAINAAGDHSLSAISIDTDADQVILWTTAVSITESPFFLGTKTNTTVSASKLRLVESGGEVVSEGTYDFLGNWNVGALGSYRVRMWQISSIFTDRPNIDSWTSELDDREDFDGTAGAQCDSRIYIRTNDAGTGGTWTDWRPLTVGEYQFWRAEFRLVLTSTDTDFNIELSMLRVLRDQVNYT